MNTLRDRLIAEALGTFILVLMGCGAIIVNQQFDGVIGHGGIACTFGLVVMALIYAVGNVSGAHFNPAVSMSFYLAGRLPTQFLVPYIVSQITGAILAAICLRLMFPVHESLGSTQLSVEPVPGFMTEVVLTFILMFVILNVSTGHMEKGVMAGVAVGATVALDALVGGPLTGASMNPARSIGPAIVSGTLDDLWLYVAAPILGAALAAPTCRWVQGEDCCQEETSSG